MLKCQIIWSVFIYVNTHSGGCHLEVTPDDEAGRPQGSALANSVDQIFLERMQSGP